MLDAWSDRLDGDVLLVLDQFEEYFLYHGDEEGERTLFEELPRALNRGTSQANVLISIREDAYARLDRFKGRIPFLYDNHFESTTLIALQRMLRPSGRSRSGIGGSRRRMSMSRSSPSSSKRCSTMFRPETSCSVNRARNRGSREGREPRIETPFLQLVLERLWTLELDSGADCCGSRR